MTRWFVVVLALLMTLFLAFAMAYADLNSDEQEINGAQGDIPGSTQTIDQRAQSVFKSMGIQAMGQISRDGGSLQILNGMKDGTDVQVRMNQNAAGETHVAVTAQAGPAGWNKDLAENVLNQITIQMSQAG